MEASPSQSLPSVAAGCPEPQCGPLIASSNQTPILIVPTDVIVQKLKPLCSLSESRLRELVESYDEANVGGLSEIQWASFCRHNRKLIASLGESIVDFDSSGEYSIATVEHGDIPQTIKRNTTLDGVAQGVVRFLEGFVAGGIAGAVSKTIIAPGDRVKIIFQVDSSRRFSFREAIQLGVQTVREFGVTGLWIGNGATMLRVVPYAAITYVSFDFYNKLFQAALNQNENGDTISERRAVTVRFLSGALAGATSTTFTYPLDLMRARFAARSSSGKRRFPSYIVAFREATAKDGIKSLYSGLFPTVVGIMPYAGCSFACFETIKHYLVRVNHYHSDKDIPTWQRLAAGGFSGLIAQSATYPLDIVRRRMQVTPGRYRGILHALSVIYREEGLRQGLYKGLAMNWIKGPIATATSFTVNDLVKRRTRGYYETTAVHSSKENVLTLSEAFVCGGVAAGVAKFWSLPFDRLKIMYQLGLTDGTIVASHSGNLSRLWHLVRRSPNVFSYGRTTMMRVVPYGALTYCSFDVFQTVAERLMYSHHPSFATNFVAGAAAAALSTFLVYPLDLLRTRSAACCVPSFQSYYWLFRASARRHGIPSLWKGCYLSMVGVGVMAGMGFAVYEDFKERFGCDTFRSRLVVGMTAGYLGQIFTYPLSVAKRNRQAEQVVFARMAKPLDAVFAKPSLYRALYRKMPFSWTMNSLTFGISFAVNDACRDLVATARKDLVSNLVLFPHS